MQSTRKMYVDALLGEQPPNDVLQEALPNVIAAHTVQAYLGGYGAMVHPVAACATAAVSVEEGVDKIRLDKASVVVAGGFDDLGIEGILGFGNMSATADTAEMLAKGIDERHVCRPNDRRRGGFVEGQGGGTVVLARGDVAARDGPARPRCRSPTPAPSPTASTPPSPPRGWARWAPASAARSRRWPRASRRWAWVPTTSRWSPSTTPRPRPTTPTSRRCTRSSPSALGRSVGNPLFVVSQKSLTGHAKGGAAAFQLNGLCQMLAGGTLPPNRGLDCVDEDLAEHEHLVWLRRVAGDRAVQGGRADQPRLRSRVRHGRGRPPGCVRGVALEVAEARPGSPRRRARLVAGEARRLDAMTGGARCSRRPRSAASPPPTPPTPRPTRPRCWSTRPRGSATTASTRGRPVTEDDGRRPGRGGCAAADRRSAAISRDPSRPGERRRRRHRRRRHHRLRRAARRARHPVRAGVHPR